MRRKSASRFRLNIWTILSGIFLFWCAASAFGIFRYFSLVKAPTSGVVTGTDLDAAPAAIVANLGQALNNPTTASKILQASPADPTAAPQVHEPDEKTAYDSVDPSPTPADLVPSTVIRDYLSKTELAASVDAAKRLAGSDAPAPILALVTAHRSEVSVDAADIEATNTAIATLKLEPAQSLSDLTAAMNHIGTAPEGKRQRLMLYEVARSLFVVSPGLQTPENMQLLDGIEAQMRNEQPVPNSQ